MRIGVDFIKKNMFQLLSHSITPNKAEGGCKTFTLI